MLNRSFDLHQAHGYVRYARMSTDMQNSRSPQQQFDTIDEKIRRGGHKWTSLGDYRDDAISGQFVTKRPEFQRMLADLRSGRVKAKLILVDTFERLGRADEITTIRKELQNRYKILVLTADSNFSDPTTPGGRALAMIEDMRATEDNRIKAHNVSRGKRDLARRGRWPGGPVPTGLQLESILVNNNGCQEIDGHRLVINPATKIAPFRAFMLTFEHSWGMTRVARALNNDPLIPPELKPISVEHVRLWLRNTLYKGVLTYNKSHVGIIDDKYIREPSEPDEWVIVENFCAPLISPEIFERVNELRIARNEARGRKSKPLGTSEGDEFYDAGPEARKYLLSGLVWCGDCQARMTLGSTLIETADGESGYRYYRCRNQPAGLCHHRSGVREDALRAAVIAKVRWRLFPPPRSPDSVPAWLPALTEEVRQRIEATAVGEDDPRPALVAERKQIDEQTMGWGMSLANSKLETASRSLIEGLLAKATSRLHEIERTLAELEATRTQMNNVLDQEAVLERLRCLNAVLASGNVPQGNRQLRGVIDRIVCFADGRIELKTVRLGLFEGAASWLYPAAKATPVVNDSSRFWSDPVDYVKPVRGPYRSWARDHAAEVLAKRQETGWTIRQLSQHFGVCWETMDKALKLAAPSAPPSDSGEATSIK